MISFRTWIGHVLVRMPVPIRSLRRRFPSLLAPLQRLSWRLSPPGARVWVKVRSNVRPAFWLLLDPRYHQDYWYGRYEVEVQHWLWGVLSPGKVFCDVGAHIGFFSAIAAQAVGPSGKVFAFEPDPDNARRLRVQLERNCTPWVQVIEKAAWSKNDKLAFARASELSGRSTGGIETSQTDTDKDRGATEILAIPLSDFFRDHSSPDVFKIDVEGAETEVLRGMTEILTKKRPSLIIEIHNPEAALQCASILQSQSYQFQQFDEKKEFPAHWVASPQ